LLLLLVCRELTRKSLDTYTSSLHSKAVEIW
jgi:hypothetical protein